MLEFLHGQASAGQVQQSKSGKLMVSRLLLLDLSTNVNNIFHSYSLLYHGNTAWVSAWGMGKKL